MQFFHRSVIGTVQASVFLEFFLNITGFSLPFELFILPVVAVLVLLSFLGSTEERYMPAKRIFDPILGVIGVCLIVATARNIYLQRHDLDVGQLWRSLALVIWLPVVALPAIYVLALFAGYEEAFLRMEFANDRQPPGWKARFALIVGLNGRVHEVNTIRGLWARRVAVAPSFRLALQQVRGFRRDRTNRQMEERERQARLVRFAGVDGTNASGRRLDQREFAETKDALQWLGTCQIGWYRSRDGRYRPDLLEILGDFSRRGLPDAHGIEMHVRSDGKAWYAWRRTASNWVFAIGAAKEPPDQWLYDGASPPQGFPGTDATWGDRPFANSTNW